MASVDRIIKKRLGYKCTISHKEDGRAYYRILSDEGHEVKRGRPSMEIRDVMWKGKRALIEAARIGL
jgi:hypothetical protein